MEYSEISSNFDAFDYFVFLLFLFLFFSFILFFFYYVLNLVSIIVSASSPIGPSSDSGRLEKIESIGWVDPTEIMISGRELLGLYEKESKRKAEKKNTYQLSEEVFESSTTTACRALINQRKLKKKTLEWSRVLPWHINVWWNISRILFFLASFLKQEIWPIIWQIDDPKISW